MKPDVFFSRIVEPALQFMAKEPDIDIAVDDRARVLVMTVCGQESAWTHRRQIGGPARGFPQFERFGGVAELFQKTPRQLGATCASFDIPYDPDVVFEAMAWHGILACVMARLLLWQDPAPLPAVGAKEAAWDYYIRNWRPGAPHHDSWAGLYDQAAAVLPVVGKQPMIP